MSGVLLHTKLQKVMRKAMLFSLSIAIPLLLAQHFFDAKQAIQKEGEYLSDLVFERLYSTMRTGWEKHEIDTIFADLNARTPDLIFEMYRSPAVEAQYGVRHVETGAPDEISFMNESTKPASIRYSFRDGVIYDKRIVFQAECLSCHANVAAGETAGLISIHYPLSEVRVGVWGHIVGSVLSILLVMSLLYALFQKFVLRNIEESIDSLAAQIDGISDHGDLEARIDIGSDVEEFRRIQAAFNNKNRRLRDAYNRVSLVSVTDELTGLFNRKRVKPVIAKELSRYRRHGTPFSLVMMDLDGFKQLNDTYGHQTGDRALVEFATLIAENLRPTDTGIRLGGDEFLVVLAHTGQEQAKQYIGRFLKRVSEHSFEHDEMILVLRTSIGFAVCGKNGEDMESLLAAADSSMYENKRSRKNAVQKLSIAQTQVACSERN